MDGAQSFVFIQFQFSSFGIGVVIKQREQDTDCDVTQAVNHHERGDLPSRREHVVELFLLNRETLREPADNYGKEKLERIYVKQNDKQKDCVQYDNICGLQAITPRVNIVVVPDLDEHGKA